jgi:hypothetical protein
MENSRESTNSEDEQIILDEEQMMEQIKKFYCPINLIPGIENEIIEYMEMEERAFMEQLAHDSYLFNIVRDLFTNLRMDKCTVNDECKASLIMMVTRALSRRADRCCVLANEVTKAEYTQEIIGKVEKEIKAFMLMLEPSTLTEEDVKKEEKLKFSHDEKISILQRKVSGARQKVLRHQVSVKERKVAAAGDERCGSDDDSGSSGSEIPKPPEKPSSRILNATTARAYTISRASGTSYYELRKK